MERYLYRLWKQTLSKQNFEVLLVDGASSDDTVARVRAFAVRHPDLQVRLWELPEVTRTESLNLCIREARGDIIARIDGHTFVASDYLENLRRRFERADARVMAVGGPVRALRLGYWGHAAALLMQSRFAVGRSPFRQARDERVVRSVQNAAYRKSVFGTIGRFDERLPGGEDEELNWRLTRAGYQILLAPELRFLWAPRRSPLGLFRQFQHYGRDRVLVLRKHPTFGLYKFLLPPLFTLGVLTAPFVAFAAAGLWKLYATGLGTYLAAALISSATLCRRGTLRFYPALMLLSFLLHLGYGSGVLLETFRIRIFFSDLGRASPRKPSV